MTSKQLSVGPAVLLTGLVVALAGSFTDNLLGSGTGATALQVALWVVGGLLLLAGVASTAMLRGGQRAARRPAARRGSLRPTVR